GGSAHQWVSAYSLLSPSSKVQAVKALDALKPTKIKPVPSLLTVIFMPDREVKVSSSLDGAYSPGIYVVVTELAKAKQYNPLMLFTIANTFHLYKEGHLLKETKSSIDGTINHFLDLSQFKAKETMDALTWQEVWQHNISWLAEVAEPTIHECWSWHFSTLLKDEAIHDKLKAILSFNIRMHSCYTAQSFQHYEHDWQVSLMHQPVRIQSLHARARSPFEMVPPPLTPVSNLIPCVSSVSILVIASWNARRRLRQRTNKLMPSMPEDNLSVTPMAPLSALPIILPTLREFARTPTPPPSISVPSAAKPLMVPSP
ncbi:hypothetical protein PAXRUDRAFT_772148, partial [Paxillus rubicundulus Ve08.2h10]